jgi:RNA polymerase primary sigma factor
MREIARVKLLTPKEEIELAARLKQGDRRARDQMISANLRLVVKIARAYQGIGVPLQDLISEGNIGLVKAIERFDPSKGGKLSTYSAPWIKHAIRQVLANESKATRLPMHVVDRLGTMRRAWARLLQESGHEPSDEELAVELGISVSRIGETRMAVAPAISFDTPTDGDDSRTYGEMMADEKAEMPDRMLQDKLLKAMVSEMIGKLPRQQQRILNTRFGLSGEQPKTLEKIGNELGLTDERVRQLQNAALVKLRRRLKTMMKNSPIRQFSHIDSFALDDFFTPPM